MNRDTFITLRHLAIYIFLLLFFYFIFKMQYSGVFRSAVISFTISTLVYYVWWMYQLNIKSSVLELEIKLKRNAFNVPKYKNVFQKLEKKVGATSKENSIMRALYLNAPISKRMRLIMVNPVKYLIWSEINGSFIRQIGIISWLYGPDICDPDEDGDEPLFKFLIESLTEKDDDSNDIYMHAYFEDAYGIQKNKFTLAKIPMIYEPKNKSDIQKLDKKFQEYGFKVPESDGIGWKSPELDWRFNDCFVYENDYLFFIFKYQ